MSYNNTIKYVCFSCPKRLNISFKERSLFSSSGLFGQFRITDLEAELKIVDNDFGLQLSIYPFYIVFRESLPIIRSAENID